MNKTIKEIAYKVADFFLLGRGIKRQFGKFALRLPTRYFRYFPGDYEAENIRLIDEHVVEGMMVVDVGAHIGLISTIIGKKVGKKGHVYSFEPTPTTFSVLKRTISINRLEKVIIPVNAALSHKSGKTLFYISDNSADNSNSLVNNNRTDRKEMSVEVTLVSLDEFVEQMGIPALNFVKIDAEGAELHVLKGGEGVIREHKPNIILALHPSSIANFGDSLGEIWDFIERVGYFVSIENIPMSKNDFVSKTELFDVFIKPRSAN